MEYFDPIVYSVKRFQNNQKKVFVLPNLISICLFHFTFYRTIKISCKSALVKPRGKMEWNNVNSNLWSVSYLPFLLRLNITQIWPLLILRQFILTLPFLFLPNLHFHLVRLWLFAVTVGCSSSVSWDASMGPQVAISTYAFRNTSARSSASATSPLSSPQNGFMPPPLEYRKQSLTEFYDCFWTLSMDNVTA